MLTNIVIIDGHVNILLEIEKHGSSGLELLNFIKLKNQMYN